MIEKATRGYLCVIVAAIMWASSGNAGKALFQGGMTPFELVQVRVTLAGLILGTIFALFRRDLYRIRPKDIGYLFLLGGVGMAMVQFTYLYTISKIQVMAAILLQYLAPILVAFYSILFWGERLTAAKVAGLVLAMTGCYLVVGGYNLELLHMNRFGIIGGLSAGVCFAAYALLGERAMHSYSPWTVVFYAMCFAAVTWHVIYHPFQYLTASYGPYQWSLILYIVVVGTIAPFGLYFVGINYIRSTRAMITATLEPISAGLIAYLFLGERLDILQMAGAGLVVAAIVTLQLQKEQDSMTPEVIRHRPEQP